jgi:anti-sigma regulatory factor (Ser/Thr protein kinase)
MSALAHTSQVALTEPSQVAEARRAATRLARHVGFDDVAAGRAALVVTEAATNVLKHAGEGQVLLAASAGPPPAVATLEVVALDRGPGIADLALALRDGHSTAGTAGNGLGAIRRLADVFDLYSAPGRGTALVAQLLARRENPPSTTGLAVGGHCLPQRGETLSGDAWAARPVPEGLRVVVADGLGHGPDAHAAAMAALDVFDARPDLPLPDLLEAMHAALRTTRGAAVGVAEVQPARGQVRFAAVGNIAGAVWAPGGQRRSFVSHNGIVGAELERVQAFVYDWPPGATLVLHSDGLTSHAGLEPYPGLAVRHPSVVAGVLYRDFNRGRDDSSVVVVNSWRSLPTG